MKDEIMSVIVNFAECTLDDFIPDGFIKKLPIVGIAFSTIKIGKQIHDRIFIEKLKSFIKYINENQKWKEKFSDEEECYKIAKQLLYIVDSCDDDDKLKLIGLVFNSLVNGEVTKDEYFYIVSLISKSFYPFLKILSDIDESDERFTNDGTKYDYTCITHLLNIGVLDFNGQTITPFNSQTGEVGLPFSIVILNKYSKFIKKLLNKLN